MNNGAEALERELIGDLLTLGERFADEEFSAELYRALTNNVWRKEGGPSGELSLSWSRAEELVNDLRTGQGQSALTLAQTGGEGEISDLVRGELARLGWRAHALDTARSHPAHLAQPESPPPPEHGERHAPVDDSVDWEELAHEEADRAAGGAASRGATRDGDTGATE